MADFFSFTRNLSIYPLLNLLSSGDQLQIN